MTSYRFWSDTEKLDLVLDVLRANDLHQEACGLRQTEEANRHGGMYFYPKPCTCWLSDPADPPALPDGELRVDVHRNAVPNAEASARVTHLPTGVVATATAATERKALAEAKAELAEKVATLRAAS